MLGDIQFRTIVGAAADVKELEYIAALLQTSTLARENGLVSSIDIQRLLCSRYGVQISHRQAIELVSGFAGTSAMEEKIVERVIQQRQQQRKGNRVNRISTHSTSIISPNEKQKVFLMSDMPPPQDVQIEGKVRSNELCAGTYISSNEEERDVVIDTLFDVPGNDSLLEDAIRDITETETTMNVQAIIQAPVVREGPGHPTSVIQQTHPLHSPISLERQDDVSMYDDFLDADLDDIEIPEVYVDIVQLTALLLIPTFADGAKAFRVTCTATENNVNEPVCGDSASEYTPPSELFVNGRRMLIKSVFIEQGQEWPFRMCAELVESILLEAGELERAQDVQLIEAMVEAARSTSGCFDEEALVNALTSDLKEWETGNENRMTSMLYDVFQQDDPRLLVNSEQDKGNNITDIEHELDEEQLSMQKQKDEIHTGIKAVNVTNVDFVVDSHSSVTVVVIIWMFYILMTLTYIALSRTLVTLPCERFDSSADPDSFGCVLAGVLWQWFAFAIFATFFGLIIMVPLSLGNVPFERNPIHLILPILLTAVYSVIPPFVVREFEEGRTEPYNEPEELVGSPFWQLLRLTTFVFGAALFLVFCFHLLINLFRKRRQTVGRINTFFSTSNTHGDIRLKQSASRKVNSMLCNALSLHASDSPQPIPSVVSMHLTHKQLDMDRTMLNYVLRGQQEKTIGGFFWTFKRIYTGELFHTDGIWIPTRILMFQAGQIIIALLVG